MTAPRVKFYQTGSFAVGNRLLDPARRSTQSDVDRANAITSGHRACQGCGEALGARYVLDAAMRATDAALGLDIELLELHTRAVTAGKDAMAEVVVRIRHAQSDHRHAAPGNAAR